MTTFAHANVRLINTSSPRPVLCQGCPCTIAAGRRHLVALTPAGVITLESHYCNDVCRAARLAR